MFPQLVWLNGIVEHLETIRTGSGHQLCLSRYCLIDTIFTDTLPGMLFHPHPTAAAATAETAFLTFFHLDKFLHQVNILVFAGAADKYRCIFPGSRNRDR